MNHPEFYRKHNNLQKRDNLFTLENYLNLIRWKKDPKVLDLGSGDGSTTIEILEPRLPCDYVKLVGSDLEEKMVEYANNLSRKLKMKFVQFDISGERILSEKFDHIFSFYAIHWVKDLRKGCRNIYDLLSPGGTMLVNMVAKAPYYDYLQSLIDHPVWGSYYRGPIPTKVGDKKREETLRMYLESAGFVDIQMEIVEREFVYPDWTVLINSYLSVDPIISELNDVLKVEYIKDHRTMFMKAFKEFEEENGEIRALHDLLIAYASKPE